MLEKGKKFLNICLSTFLLLSIIFLFSVQNVKAEEETDTINPDEIQMSVDSLLTGISSKGFHPSKGNYLSIRAGVSFNTEQDLEGTAINVRLRILNKSGKYVYEKTGNPKITEKNADYEEFKKALNYVNTTLAKKIAGDGEGATALFEVKVIGALFCFFSFD